MLTAFVKALWSMDDSRATFIPFFPACSFPFLSVLNSQTDLSRFIQSYALSCCFKSAWTPVEYNCMACWKTDYKYERIRDSCVNVNTIRQKNMN